MSVCVNDLIPPNECDATTPPDIDKIPCTPAHADSISNVSETSQVPSYPSNTNFSQEEYGLIY